VPLFPIVRPSLQQPPACEPHSGPLKPLAATASAEPLSMARCPHLIMNVGLNTWYMCSWRAAEWPHCRRGAAQHISKWASLQVLYFCRCSALACQQASPPQPTRPPHHEGFKKTLKPYKNGSKHLSQPWQPTFLATASWRAMSTLMKMWNTASQHTNRKSEPCRAGACRQSGDSCLSGWVGGYNHGHGACLSN
jgi:hypothetical protein